MNMTYQPDLIFEAAVFHVYTMSWCPITSFEREVIIRVNSNPVNETK